MVNRNLIRSLESDPELRDLFDEVVSGVEEGGLATIETEDHFDVNQIVRGRIIRVDEDSVLVDVGFKSEGTIPREEFEEDEWPPREGDTIQVLVEEVEDEMGAADDPHGMVSLSKRKAEKIIKWQEMIERVKEGEVVTGVVTRKIKGGLLVDIGVNVFLPASQVDIRRPGDIGDYIGRYVQCEVLKIDESRRNIVVSRRSLIEKQREEDREQLLRELEVGQVRKGVVKNIADFGAFVDLGGIDGLLHITDMSWERIGHPSEMVSIDQEIEVVILHIDREKQKIALGLKQTQENPWENVADKYPVGTIITGKVRNLTNYGAFIELEEGIDGLLHVSDMSWTRKISHPSEMLEKGQEVRCKILSVDQERRRIALGLKQLDEDPWVNEIPRKYQPGQVVTGTVTKITNFGVFVGLEDGLEGLLHISELADHKVENPEEVVKVGDEIEVKILRVDTEERKIGLSRKRVEWAEEDEAAAEEKAKERQPRQDLKGGLADSGPLIPTGQERKEGEEEG